MITIQAPNNKAVQSFDALGNIACALDAADSESCTLEFHVTVKSYNGTIGLGNTLEVTLRSECKILGTVYDTSIWSWSSGNMAKVQAGYAVRDSTMSIDMPLLQPELPSQSDILSTCGELIYTFLNPD